jgi:hypothetical protein
LNPAPVERPGFVTKNQWRFLMKTDHTLPVARLRDLVRYDPGTGHFVRPNGERLPESLAGRYGRLQINVDGTLRYAARVAFAYVHGVWPEGQVDHINGDHTDNRIGNLRVLTNAQNAQNRRRAREDNSTGYLGVSFDKRKVARPYRARIMVNDRMVSLGYFDTAEEAHSAYLVAKRDLHPFWAGADAA